MPSITNYTETLKPYNGIGNRGFMAGPMLLLLLFLFLGTSIKEEYFRIIEHQQMAKAGTWPSAMAKVANVTTSKVSVREGRYSSHPEYEVNVEYGYQVKGQNTYAKQAIFLDYPYRRNLTGATYMPEDEKRIESEYQKGSTHAIRYDPDKPGTSYIDWQVAPDGASDQQRRSFIIGSFVVGALVVSLFSSGITKMR